MQLVDCHNLLISNKVFNLRDFTGFRILCWNSAPKAIEESGGGGVEGEWERKLNFCHPRSAHALARSRPILLSLLFGDKVSANCESFSFGGGSGRKQDLRPHPVVRASVAVAVAAAVAEEFHLYRNRLKSFPRLRDSPLGAGGESRNLGKRL